MAKILHFDPNKCSGCRTCELVCSWTLHRGVIRPALSRTRVIKKEEAAVNVPMTCQQCEHAPCEAVCPVKAIAREETTGALMIDHASCIGCRACLMFCPFGAIGQDPDDGVMIKCDLCGGDPKCIRWCPNEAIRYEEARIETSKKQRQVVDERIKEGLLGTEQSPTPKGR